LAATRTRGRDGRQGRARATTLAGALCLLATPLAAGDWQRKGVTLENPQAGIELSLTGFLQVDLRGYPNWDVDRPTQRRDAHDVRRARTGVGVRWRKLRIAFDVDYAAPLRKLIDDGPGPFLGAEVKNLYAEYAFSKKLRVRGGTFKPPVSPEFLTAVRKTDFVERSMLANSLGLDRDWGGMLLAGLGSRLEVQAGVFAGDGRTSLTSSGAMFAARAVLTPLAHLDLGGSFSQGDVTAQGERIALPKSFNGRSPTGYPFRNRTFVEGSRVRVGLDATYLRGPVGLKIEWLQGREQRKGRGASGEDLATLVGNGFSATATWLVTGEKKAATIRPSRPLPAGPGAVELALRYERLLFCPLTLPAGSLDAAGDEALWAGVSWLPRSWLRLYGDVVLERYRDPTAAPEPPGSRPGAVGRGNYVSLLARIELLIP
jgi:phosphate-selective porin